MNFFEALARGALLRVHIILERVDPKLTVFVKASRRATFSNRLVLATQAPLRRCRIGGLEARSVVTGTVKIEGHHERTVLNVKGKIYKVLLLHARTSRHATNVATCKEYGPSQSQPFFSSCSQVDE